MRGLPRAAQSLRVLTGQPIEIDPLKGEAWRKTVNEAWRKWIAEQGATAVLHPPIAAKVRALPVWRELHIVGFYEGAYPPGVSHSGDVHPQGTASVRVDRPGISVVLALCAYEPIRWSVTVTPGTVVERIILGGYHEQVVEEREGVPVDDLTIVKDRARELLLAYDPKDDHYAPTCKALSARTKLPVTSAQGQYKNDPPQVWVVNAGPKP